MATDLVYEVDLNNRQDDNFHVNLFVNNLKAENAIFQFASSAPGTYRTMDIGRFVKGFNAFDREGKEIPTEQISTNQWQISNPEKVVLIQYCVAETWDTPVDSNSVYVMCGTSMENDHTLINGQAVFGYPTGMQKRPLKIKLLYPKEWLVGTALSQDKNGFYFANDYDHIVDSPILLGRLTSASLDVQGTKVEVYTYSGNDVIKADEILNSVEDILNASAEFIEEMPVERYTFLFHFENKSQFGAGAWEHNYSSIYAFPEAPIETMLKQGLPGTMAHEFFHIITPLQIHSELVEHFDFVKPQPSAHLWLYESTTEWAAKIMQLRGGLVDLDKYLSWMKRKLIINDHFNPSYSLLELSKNSFSVAGQKEYGNVYHGGAMIAGLLDIRLLELSGGKRGLREVINELAKTYGPEKSFDEKTFFQTFTKKTYPEIEQFFDLYIKKANPMPLAEYFSKLGISYKESYKSGKIDTTSGLGITYKNEALVLEKLDSVVLDLGLQNGDKLLKFNGEEINIGNIRSVFGTMNKLGAGESFGLTVSRNDKELDFTITKFTREKIEKHSFELMEDASEEQIALRKAWMKNL
ncbi:MAG: peptidase [Calditrichaeota bacterium]|nr:MAG: peptidase [Calditrichota bacterium]MBL1205483.1 peptidase [Calditrichota bacterium]NOG45311.1 peptidase [Calditrichota bacterium]